MIDFYKVLGVPRDATPEQVKAVYRKLSKRHHPDRGGDAQKFREVQQAYEVLGDQERRAAYDAGEWCGAKGSLRERAESALCEAFSTYADKVDDLDSTDMFDTVQRGVEQQLRVAVDRGIMANGKADQLAMAAEQAKRRTGGDNFVSALLLVKAEDARRVKAKIAEQEGLLKEMLVVLEEFGCKSHKGGTGAPAFVQDIKFSIYGRQWGG